MAERLSEEQLTLMTWLSQQSEPISMAQMETEQVPCFSENRVKALKESGHLLWEYVSYEDDSIAGYYLSDKGLAALQEQKELCDKAAEEKSAKRTDRKFQIALSLVSAVIGSLVTLFVEHFSEILSCIHSVLQ